MAQVLDLTRNPQVGLALQGPQLFMRFSDASMPSADPPERPTT